LDARSVFHGFLLTGGHYTTLDDPHAGTGAGTLQGTVPTGINASGAITGFYIGPNNDFHGFLLNQGQYTTIDEPNAAPGPFLGTEAVGINTAGQIVGNYEDAKFVIHGFLLANGQYTTLDDPNAGTAAGDNQGTQPDGINDSGNIVGFYVASNRRIHGFLATPAPGATAVGAATVNPAAATLILFPQTAPASAATSAATEHPPAVPANAVNPPSANAAPDGTLSHANTLASALPSAVAHLRAAALAQQISDSLFGGVAGEKLWSWDS
jgi:probable HAF family extracellular repeat protein